MKPNLIDPTSFPKDHIVSVAMRLVSRHWFLCYSKLMAMQWEWTTETPYGSTNGKTLRLNKAGLAKIQAQPQAANLLAFLLVHEALHALLGHGWRLAPLPNPMLANVSADYVVNAMIAARNRELGKDVFKFIDGILIDEQLSGDMSVIELYRKLSKPEPQPESQSDQTQPDDNDDTEHDDQADKEPDNGDGSDEGDDQQDGDAGEGDAGESTDSDSDAGDDTGGDDSTDGDGGAPDGDLSDFVGTGAPDLFAPEADGDQSVQDVIDEMEQDNERILIADELDKRTSGTAGSTGTRVAEQRADKADLDWPTLVREWLLRKTRTSGWESPVNVPIGQSTGLVCAGRRSKRAGTIVLALDTSGSIGAVTYAKFLQQAQDILDELHPESLVLLSVSHVVADAVILEDGDIAPTSLKGGGGTLFQPAFDWLRDNDIEPDVMVYLTDGYSDDLPSIVEPEFPLLWLTTCLPTYNFKVGEALRVFDF